MTISIVLGLVSCGSRRELQKIPKKDALRGFKRIEFGVNRTVYGVVLVINSNFE